MFLKEVIIKNFRSYKNEHRIQLDQLTAFIGKNDAGKSSILDALAIFFEHPLGKIDISDICVHEKNCNELRIGCVFSDFPESIIIDKNSTTNLKDEYLLNEDGMLEIHKVYEISNGTLKKPKVFAIANHPTNFGSNDLLLKKNSELKDIVQNRNISEKVKDKRSNVSLRHAIWEDIKDLKLGRSEIQLDKEDAKTIWEQLSKYLPEYALFRADRPSTDEDSEIQDPLKVAIKQAIIEVEAELESVKNKIKEYTLDVANRTIEKLADFDSHLSAQLVPNFKTDPKWDSLFKLSLIGDNEIPINKRGSGVRRLILFSFFRAEAERIRSKNKKGNIIYAVEEPETAQHPDNQQKIIKSLQTIAQSDGCQVLLTTHVPGLASLLPVDSIRYVCSYENNNHKVHIAKNDNSIMNMVVDDLGIIPDKRIKVILCVEGKNDIQFLKHICTILRQEDESVVDICSDPRVACIPLGGSNLKEWVNQNYLKNLGIPEIHIYDRDSKLKASYEYEAEAVNQRGDNSIAFITKKREMENYLHIDVINGLLQLKEVKAFTFVISDECDVEGEIKEELKCNKDAEKIIVGKIKSWLNDKVAEKMTIEYLKIRGGYDEIKMWFDAIRERVS